MISEIRHAGIVVSDMDKASQFYCNLLGLKIANDFIEESDHIDAILGFSSIRLRIVKLSIDDRVLIELLHFVKPQNDSISPPVWNLGCSHVAFTVHNIDKEFDKLSKNGVRFNCPPCISPDGYAKYTYCQDPDGTNIELVEVL